MRIEFWGAAGDVTGSMHVVQVGGKRLLLDCGLYQGRRQVALDRNRRLPFPASSIDAVILSHAHIDHSGNLPTLVRQGYRGKIHATPATRDLAGYMLMDSAKIQEGDVAHLNRRRARMGEAPIEPLYGSEHAELTLTLFDDVPLGHSFEPIQGVKAHFKNAGHMLGSAIVVLDIDENGGSRRLVFSGDLGAHGIPILKDPDVVSGANLLIMESTYGDRDHEPTQETIERLKEIVLRTHEEKGRLLIPAFAVGRTQEIVYRLNLLAESRQLPPIDVFIDSPLAINVTDVFRLHPECYDAEMAESRKREADRDPLSFSHLHYVREAASSKRLNGRPGPMVVIAASGMCESGRILHHLANHLGNPKTTVLFAGFQAEHTLGRKLLEGKNPVMILGEEHPVRARIERLEGCSAHAGRSDLIAWADKAREQGELDRVFLVHGEEPARRSLALALKERGFSDVRSPTRGNVYQE